MHRVVAFLLGLALFLCFPTGWGLAGCVGITLLLGAVPPPRG